jgi:hypothetical protein
MERPEGGVADRSPPQRSADENRQQAQDDEGYEASVEGENGVCEEACGGGTHRWPSRGDRKAIPIGLSSLTPGGYNDGGGTMTDPYADVDPSRGRWIWWAVGLYGVSFLVPTVPLGNSGSFSLGIQLFVISFIIFVAGLINPGTWGSERDATAFLLFGLPWLANPLLWWCLVAWADGRRRTAAVTGLLAFLCGLAAIYPGFIFAPYWVWMASLTFPQSAWR